MHEIANPENPGKCVRCGYPSGHVEEPFCMDCEGELTSRECKCCGMEMGYNSGTICPICRDLEN